MQKSAETFARLLTDGVVKDNIEIRYMSPTEAEAVKLFANATRKNFIAGQIIKKNPKNPTLKESENEYDL